MKKPPRKAVSLFPESSSLDFQELHFVIEGGIFWRISSYSAAAVIFRYRDPALPPYFHTDQSFISLQGSLLQGAGIDEEGKSCDYEECDRDYELFVYFHENV